MGGGDKKEANILRIVLINSHYFTVGVKDETNFKSFDACHATRHIGPCGYTITGSKATKCNLDG